MTVLDHHAARLLGLLSGTGTGTHGREPQHVRATPVDRPNPYVKEMLGSSEAPG